MKLFVYFSFLMLSFVCLPSCGIESADTDANLSLYGPRKNYNFYSELETCLSNRMDCEFYRQDQKEKVELMAKLIATTSCQDQGVWVLTPENVLVIGKGKSLKHSLLASTTMDEMAQLLKGKIGSDNGFNQIKHILTGGEFWIRGGKLHINNKSGHYRPDVSSLEKYQAVKAFETLKHSFKFQLFHSVAIELSSCRL